MVDNINIPEILESKLASFDYFSFDLFDTLLRRTVHRPTDIRGMVACLYEERHGVELWDYPVKRGLAESKARAYHRHEVNLDEIYAELDYSDEICEELKQLEEECEIENCVPNKDMVSFAQKCYDSGKTVVITTDMYLPRKTIEAILEKLNVRYNKLYLSCEVRKTKKDGELFEWLLQDLNVQAGQLIHIGDNPVSDNFIPRGYGIHTILYQSAIPVLPDNKDYLSALEGGIEANHLGCVFDIHAKEVNADEEVLRIGYTVLGPFLFSFCKWVHEIKRCEGIDRLLFLARDGYLMHKCYSLMYPYDDVDYICLNKNLLRLPSLAGDDGIKNFIRSLPPRRAFLWKEVFAHLGIKEPQAFLQIGDNAITYGADEVMAREEILSGKYDEKTERLFNYQRQNIEKQKDLLDKYLSQNGFYDKKIGMVNNSMEGSAQILVEKFAKKLNRNTDIVGVQFTATPSCVKKLSGRLKTFFDGEDEPKRWGKIFRSCPLPFEHLVFEPIGTARAFREDEDGNVRVIHDDCGKECEDFEVKSKIQEESLTFVSDYINHVPLDIENLSKRMFFKLFQSPYMEDARLIGGFWDVDVERTRRINTPPLSPVYQSFTQRSRRHCMDAWLPLGNLCTKISGCCASNIDMAICLCQKSKMAACRCL